MSLRRFAASHRTAGIVVFDILVFSAWFYLIPALKRPYYAFTGVALSLCLLTALLARPNWLRNCALVVFTLVASLLGLEMLQKHFNILSYAERPPPEPWVGTGGKYAWNLWQPESYMEARKRAIADGVEPEAFKERFAGDIFAGLDRSRISVRRFRAKGWNNIIETYTPDAAGAPLERDGKPFTLLRSRSFYRDESDPIQDFRVTRTRFGFRETRGDPDADSAYVFLGCSFTYGAVGDEDTVPHYFSEAGGFADRVLNFAGGGFGTHQALYELQHERYARAVGLDPGTVKAVFYEMIDDHVWRTALGEGEGGYRYVLENDRVVLKEKEPPAFFRDRIMAVLENNRIFLGLRSRLYYRNRSGETTQGWRLVHAMIKEMDRLSREKYGCPLIVLYWDDDPEVMATIRNNGIRLVRVEEAFEPRWRDMSIKYLLFEGHPSAYANKRIGYYLRELVAGGAGK